MGVGRAEFTGRLHEVREIRNDVMHYSPEGHAPEVMMTLQNFATFLRNLRVMNAI